jgi:hypothetical protein
MVISDYSLAVTSAIEAQAWETDWEEDFLYAMEKHLEANKPLNRKHTLIIERIFRRITDDMPA